MSPAVTLNGVSKQYRLGAYVGDDYQTLRESLAGSLQSIWRSVRRERTADEPESKQRKFWALDDVSFDIEPGQVVGVIGRNGAGKSTLLKILSRITEPSRGRIELRGRVSSLLEVGTGFHHELTGRENIFLNGAILGMTRQEIKAKFDAIVDFAEVEKFLDTPVKRYSSGMFVRLAFAVAAHLEPEVLIVDEVLAVGDGAFQRKCLGKMGEVSRSGRTVVFVSHNMATVVNLCEKVAVLDKGTLRYFGSTREGVAQYVHDGATDDGSESILWNHANRRGGSEAILGKARLMDDSGMPCNQFQCGGPFVCEIEAAEQCDRGAHHFAVGLDDEMGRRIFTAATYLSNSFGEAESNVRKVRCRIDSLPLAPGRYAISFNAGPIANVWQDFVDQAIWIDVQPTDYYGNGRNPKAEWGDVVVQSEWTKR